MFQLVFALLLAGAATAAFSALIDRLYSRETDELSFPDRLRERAMFRRPLLFVGCAAAFFCCDTAYPAASFFGLCFYLPLLIISVTDWEQYIIFDSVVAFLAVAGLGQSAAASYRPELFDVMTLPPGLMNAVLTGLAAGALMLLLAVVLKGSIFGGDIKLIAALGLWLGSKYMPACIALGFVLGGVAALLLLLSRQKKRDEYFAYGPYFVMAAVLVRAIGITL